MNLPTQAARDYEFDGLKALAVLAVVGCHLSKLCLHWRLTNDDFWEGACGAHLFLIASGFGMAWSLPRVDRLRDFCIERFSRVYPLYAFSIILSTALIAFVNPPVYSVTAPQFLVNLTMCQSWLGQTDIDGAYWLTGVLLKFYLLVGVVILLRGQAAVEKWSLGYLLLTIVLKATPLAEAVPSFAIGVLNIDCAHLLIAGSLLCAIRHNGNSFTRSTAFTICMGLEMVGSNAPLSSLVIVGVMIACYFRSHLTFLRSLSSFGHRLSFAIYMMHGVIGYVAMNGMAQFTSSIWTLLLVGSGSTLVAAELASRFVEAPCRQWLRAVFECEFPLNGCYTRNEYGPLWLSGRRRASE